MTASDARHMQSLMFFPLINPLCRTDVIAGMIDANLFAKILEITLNLKFATVIGLYWSTESALLVLGISTRVFELKFGNQS